MPRFFGLAFRARIKPSSLFSFNRKIVTPLELVVATQPIIRSGGNYILLKSADDKSKRETLLEELQRSYLLDTRQKKWLREELNRLKKGIQGERDSAHYLAR